MYLSRIQSPNDENELLLRCQAIEGLSFLQLANQLQLCIPHDPNKRKGWIGQAIEIALGSAFSISRMM